MSDGRRGNRWQPWHRLVLGAGLVLAIGLAPTPDPAGAAEAESEPEDETYNLILDSFRTRTDTTLTPEVLSFDDAYRDSVLASFDSTVTATGLAATLASHDRRHGSRFRAGFNFDPQDAKVYVNKVDGLALQAPGAFHVVGRGARLTVGGRLGYAFASKQGRYTAGAWLRSRRFRVSWVYQRQAPVFGWVNVHGNSWYALTGVDNQNYLYQKGWTASGGARLSRGLWFDVDYTDAEIRAMEAADIFTIGASTFSVLNNRQATPGDLRNLMLRLSLSRGSSPRVWGEVRADMAGQGLGGTLEYDRIEAMLSWIPVLPWDDELYFETRGQIVASPCEVPVQATGNPTGRTGVRGYPQLYVVGTQALYLRTEYLVSRDLIARAGIPFLKKWKLQLMAFGDVGAAWTPTNTTSIGKGVWPESSDWLWSVGLGVRKNVGLGEVLSHLRLDWAIPLNGSVTGSTVYFVMEGIPFN